MGDHHSTMIHKNQPKYGGTLERRCDRAERVGGGVYLLFEGSNRGAEKNGNRERVGAISFDGFLWMGGHNNQPNVGPSDRI